MVKILSQEDFDGLWNPLATAYSEPLHSSYYMTISDRFNIDTWSIGQSQDIPLYTASAFKVFVLAECLRQWDNNELSPTEVLEITDEVKAFASKDDNMAFAKKPPGTRVFLSYALEAMIGWSDNTATDMLLARVKPDRVREFLSGHNLQDVVIPDSLRRHFLQVYDKDPNGHYTYNELQEIAKGKPIYSPFEVDERMAAPTSAFVKFYHEATANYFQAKGVRNMYNNILEKSEPAKFFRERLDPCPQHVWAKGGRLDLSPYHVCSLAGRIAFSTNESHFLDFAFILNTNRDTDNEKLFLAFGDVITQMLTLVLGHNDR
jgi:hypothetical protein